ncbi:MAG: hypothetical protein J6Y02_10055 [Pseudobutyrivibrio sp.]|nr:hypothetical protein [Pseudobutyrivibrio sp.]
MAYSTISNRVDKATLRAVQDSTLDLLKDILSKSFGPMGSTTIIRKPNQFNRYSKDGHTILSNITFKGDIEEAVREDIEALTRHTVIGLGDSSTSIVLLAAILFKKLIKIEKNSKIPPADLIKKVKDHIAQMTKIIESRGRECTVEDIYNIALISTNNDEYLASVLKDVYEEFGMSAFIDVTISNTEQTILKSYDGLTIESGYAENAFINDAKKGTATIKKPLIYAFEDPVDTPEMVAFLEKILYDNIYKPYSGEKGTSPSDVKPTVIFAPKISRDLSSMMTGIVDWLNRVDADQSKPPLLIVTNIYESDIYNDVTKLCGCKPIKKYIDPKIQAADIKSGNAPTPDTIHNFAGSADIVEADNAKTKVVNPKNMHKPNGEYTNTFNSMVTFLEAELKKATEEGADAAVKGKLKRRLNSLKANMVEIAIGGVTVADRDSRRDLLEDAVLNCRSAAQYGVGYGANFEGLLAALRSCGPDNYKQPDIKLTRQVIETTDLSKVDTIHLAFAAAYIEISEMLYNTKYQDDAKAAETVTKSIENDCPMNIRTEEFDHKVLSSIKSDIVVLDTLAQILTLMITSNQFLTPTFLTNLYDQVDITDYE